MKPKKTRTRTSRKKVAPKKKPTKQCFLVLARNMSEFRAWLGERGPWKDTWIFESKDVRVEYCPNYLAAHKTRPKETQVVELPGFIDRPDASVIYKEVHGLGYPQVTPLTAGIVIDGS